MVNELSLSTQVSVSRSAEHTLTLVQRLDLDVHGTCGLINEISEWSDHEILHLTTTESRKTNWIPVGCDHRRCSTFCVALSMKSNTTDHRLTYFVDIGSAVSIIPPSLLLSIPVSIRNAKINLTTAI